MAPEVDREEANGSAPGPAAARAGHQADDAAAAAAAATEPLELDADVFETPRTSLDHDRDDLPPRRDADDADDDGEENPPRESLTSTRSSTSLTSPPYWTNSRGHQRNVSNVSTDSVLPAGAIMLRDNETSEHNDRNRACWAKSVEIKDHTVVNGSATNIGAFVVWNIRVETLNGSFMNIRKRYSEFDVFRSQLVQTFPSFEAAVPQLPPKSVIAKFRPRFLEKRRAGLQYFLNCIMLNPEFSGSPVLKEFLFA